MYEPVEKGAGLNLARNLTIYLGSSENCVGDRGAAWQDPHKSPKRLCFIGAYATN